MATAVQQEVACPKCGGAMWDNRLSKKNPKQPDFKCRNRACDGVIWPPRNGTRQAAPPQNNAPQPFSQGGPLPWEHEEMEQNFAQTSDQFEALCALYDRCFKRAVNVAAVAKITDQQAVVAICATLFIEANKRGIK